MSKLRMLSLAMVRRERATLKIISIPSNKNTSIILRADKKQNVKTSFQSLVDLKKAIRSCTILKRFALVFILAERTTYLQATGRGSAVVNRVKNQLLAYILV